MAELWSVRADDEACDLAMRAPGAGRVAAEHALCGHAEGEVEPVGQPGRALAPRCRIAVVGSQGDASLAEGVEGEAPGEVGAVWMRGPSGAPKSTPGLSRAMTFM